MDEFDIIAQCFAPLSAAESGAFSLTDDAAHLTPATGTSLIITKDCMIEGVHFFGTESPALIAQKLLRTNLSDLAAKGAKPRAYMLGLMLPRSIDNAWLASFAAGLKADGEQFGITLIGGDTTSGAATLCLSLTAIGESTHSALLRSGAKDGDDVYVTGTLGDSALGLKLLRGDCICDNAAYHAFLTSRYHLPEPRLAFGRGLHELAHSAMDISDGLLQDASHIATTSACGITLYADALPMSDAARFMLDAHPYLIESIATGGDDYELLFTAPVSAHDALLQLSHTTDTPITCIGQVHARHHEVVLQDSAGALLQFDTPGFRHQIRR